MDRTKSQYCFLLLLEIRNHVAFGRETKIRGGGKAKIGMSTEKQRTGAQGNPDKSRRVTQQTKGESIELPLCEQDFKVRWDS